MKQNQTAMFTLGLAILGILAKVLLIFPELTFNFNQWVLIAIYIVTPFQLEFFETDTLRLTLGSILQNINLLEGAMLLMMLLSAFLYGFSYKKEIRLIAFVLCVLFLNQLACLLMNSISTFFAFFTVQEEVFNFRIEMAILSIIKPLFFVWISHRLLKSLIFQQSPQIISTQYDTFELKEFARPSRWVRLFHLFVDVILLVLIYSIYVFGFLKPFLQSLEQTIGARPAALSYFIIVSILYYAVSEWLFGATPAKMLTQTKVLNLEGNHPSFASILGRTIYRRIPFNAFSFLGNNGWHDKFSSTQVVYLENKGVKGGRYWLLLLLLVLMVVGIIFGEQALFEYKASQEAANEYKKEVLELEKELQNLGSNNVLSFLSQEDEFDIDPFYFKVNRTTSDSVFGYYLPFEDIYWCSAYLLDRINWQYQKSNPAILAFSRKDLIQAYPKNLEDKEKRANGIKLPELQSTQYLNTIYTLGGANIKNAYTGGSYVSVLNLGFYNDGWPATITGISVQKGNLQIDPKPMITAPIIFGSQYPDFMLSFENYEKGAAYEFNMEVTDSAGNVKHYLVKGKDIEKEVIPKD